eukprot:8680145-Alexandrium_andersonii.AAC.1
MLYASDPDQPDDLFWSALDRLANEARSGQGRYRKVLAEVTQEAARGLGVGEPRPGAKVGSTKAKTARSSPRTDATRY